MSDGGVILVCSYLHPVAGVIEILEVTVHPTPVTPVHRGE